MFVEVNLLDFLLLAFAVIFVVKGRKNGLFLELVHLGGFFIALIVSLRLLPSSAQWVSRIIELAPHMSVITGFATTFALVLLLYQFIVAFILKNSKVQIEEWLNRLGGMLLGVLKGATAVSILCLGMVLFPFSKTVIEAEEYSFTFNPCKQIMPAVYDQVKRVAPGSPYFESVVDDTFLAFDLSELDPYSKKMMKEFGSDKTRELLASTQK
jgi:uncharacterized membrane protein required for colicin V production